MHEYPERTIVTLPAHYLIAIGKVSAQWGMLEAIVEKALHKFGGLDNADWRSLAFTAHMPWPQRMDILTTLIAGLKDDYPHLARFAADVHPALRKAQDGRNRVAHAFWGYDEATSTATISRVSARGRLKARREAVTVADIETIADDVGLATMQLWKLIINRL